MFVQLVSLLRSGQFGTELVKAGWASLGPAHSLRRSHPQPSRASRPAQQSFPRVHDIHAPSCAGPKAACHPQSWLPAPVKR